MRVLLLVTMIFASASTWSFSWKDLWYTPDQQAADMMQKGQYSKAGALFEQEDWQAAASYRAGNYQHAAQAYQSLNNETGFYNAGNALAHQGKYEEALKAYDQALKLNPHNQDAQYNRALVADLLKKDKEQQQKKEQNDGQSQDQKNKQEQQKQSQNSNSNQQNDQQQKQNQPQSDNSGAEQQMNKEKSQQEQQAQKEASAKENKEKQKQQNNASKTNDDKEKQAAAQAQSSLSDKEQQQAKEQWLKLIPDDPGGLLREKFLRDHIRRQRGWYQ